mmetsp:Transcript_25647/g.54786  ORF Transcript_25647/g.54786 Transcript_25647/m.54786 type:complete len:87 (-) Transcript_25647:824-1084(-)
MACFDRTRQKVTDPCSNYSASIESYPVTCCAGLALAPTDLLRGWNGPPPTKTATPDPCPTQPAAEPPHTVSGVPAGCPVEVQQTPR